MVDVGVTFAEEADSQPLVGLFMQSNRRAQDWVPAKPQMNMWDGEYHIANTVLRSAGQYPQRRRVLPSPSLHLYNTADEDGGRDVQDWRPPATDVAQAHKLISSHIARGRHSNKGKLDDMPKDCAREARPSKVIDSSEARTSLLMRQASSENHTTLRNEGQAEVLA